LRVIFAGTPEFARIALAQLHAAGFEIPLVLTQPDRPAGRGMKLQASPVKAFALEHGIPVAQPHSLKLDGAAADEAQAAREAMLAAKADVMVVAAYGLLLPQWVLESFPKGCMNIHASVLPRWRGAAPIHRAIEAGDTQTGVTIMQMDIGLDTGDMLAVKVLPITPQDTTASLHDALATLGATLMVEVLRQAQSGPLTATPQPLEGVNYAHKIAKQEAALDWTLPAAQLARRVRAFNPFPVATCALGADTIKVWQAQAVDAATMAAQPPGTVLAVDDHGVLVQCGQGVLRLTELQRAGGKRLPVGEFLRGFALNAGAVLAPV
jgi:methionyl-tRNA formyltransferase